MYRPRRPQPTSIKINQTYQGETIEQKINRIVNNKEPIKDGAPIIYTERKDGVRPEHDIRTDRFEIAVEAMDKVSKSHVAKREAKIKNINEKTDKTTENKTTEGNTKETNQGT